MLEVYEPLRGNQDSDCFIMVAMTFHLDLFGTSCKMVGRIVQDKEYVYIICITIKNTAEPVHND